jgi:hypothetical protein
MQHIAEKLDLPLAFSWRKTEDLRFVWIKREINLHLF